MVSDQPQAAASNTRMIEESVVTDFRNQQSYTSYLDLHRLLSAQHPVSVPEHHDELAFIIQHQTSELWLKLIGHELRTACEQLRHDDLSPALKGLARVKHILTTLTDQWSVLATLTPTEYVRFRDFLGHASGFQSFQYRAVEFTLGNKNAAMLKVFEGDDEALALVSEALEAPSLYDEFLRYLSRAGYPVPDEVLTRDVRRAWEYCPELVPVFATIYDDPEQHWAAYETCEQLVDVEDDFQLWRFRHLRTVQRIIGMKRGTGGSSGVPFLRRALDLTFFPELFAVRTEIHG